MILECSNCNTKLIELIETDKNVAVSYTFVAECPHCGDRSFPKATKGDVAITGTEFANWIDTRSEYSEKLGKEVFVLITAKGAKKPRVKT